MTDLTELKMNVAALKRVDPYAKHILDTATHVALYTFNRDDNEWAKTDIEGALFVYSRNGEPYNGILIMNRLNTNNLVEPVTPGLDLQLQEPFLLYRNSKYDIYGIWFYDKEECIRIANVMSKLVQDSEDNRKSLEQSPRKVKKNYGLPGNSVDIFSMLSKAQENFNTNKEIKKKVIKESSSPLDNPAMENIPSGPLLTPLGPDVTSQSVMDFFAKAKVNTGHYKSGDQPVTGNVMMNETKPLFARLIPNSTAHTLEHIEKQQRSITPQPLNQSIVQNPVVGNNVLNSSIKSKRRSKITSQHDSTLPTTASMPQDIQPPLIHSVNDTNGSTGFLRIQSPTTPMGSELVNHKSTNQINPLASLFAKASCTSDDIAGGGSISSGTKSAPALIPPTMFAAPRTPKPVNTHLEPLTRNQLLQAFNYLLNSDPEFVNKLHEAYVKSFGEILS